MGKKSRLIQAIGISTAIVISNISVAAAKSSKISSDEHSINQVNIQPNSETNTPLKKAISMPNGSFAIAQTPEANQSEETQDNTADIIKPPQQPIPSTDPLNPSPNPLSFPTQPEEVEVGTEQPITLEQAIEITLKNNKDIEEARIQVESSEAVLREARAELYPTFDLESGFGYGGNGVLFDGIAEQTAESEIREQLPDATDEQIQQLVDNQLQGTSSNTFTFSTGLGLNYNIYNGGSRGARIRSAEKQLNITELELERIVEQARFEAARDYYDLQNNDAQIRIEEAAVEDAS
ncbi:MAG: TolC family protein, partial [Waterburya sp.]